MCACSLYFGCFFFWVWELSLSLAIILSSVSIHHSSWRIHPHHGHLCKWNVGCAYTHLPFLLPFLLTFYFFPALSWLCYLLLLPFSPSPYNLLSASLFYSRTSFIYFKTDTLLLLKLHPLILLEGWALISCEWSCFWWEERERVEVRKSATQIKEEYASVLTFLHYLHLKWLHYWDREVMII